ncbi:hypothetical protein BDV24DRAFT_134107 [Aspergillus arachidicola]|uniref:Uncharacterized protein n=1 Tax=Aspergillus arachidicola TaxID=656916 RepID=A0A5N6Y748_9EURO|nr:hypothetical protein BDV24DRAFT_134107 [Aspergillus arachidicola]
MMIQSGGKVRDGSPHPLTSQLLLRIRVVENSRIPLITTRDFEKVHDPLYRGY